MTRSAQLLLGATAVLVAVAGPASVPSAAVPIAVGAVCVVVAGQLFRDDRRVAAR